MKIGKEVAQFYCALFESTPGLRQVFEDSKTLEISAIAKAHVAYIAHETPQEDIKAIATLQQQINDLGVLVNDDTFVVALMSVKGNKAEKQASMASLMTQRATAPEQIANAKTEIAVLSEGAIAAFCDTYHAASGSRTNTGPRSDIVGSVVACTFKDTTLNVSALSEFVWNVWKEHTVVLASTDLKEKHQVRTLTASRKIAQAHLGIKGKNVTIEANSPASIDTAIVGKVFNKIAASGTKGCKIVSEDAKAWEANMRQDNGEVVGKID